MMTSDNHPVLEVLYGVIWNARQLLLWLSVFALMLVAASAVDASQVRCDQPPPDWVPTKIQTPHGVVPLDDLDEQIKLATHQEPEQILSVRRKSARRVNPAAVACQAADTVTTILAIEGFGAREGNPVLGALNSGSAGERVLGYIALAGIKYGLVRLAGYTPTRADDAFLAVTGCGAAAWNAAQMN